MGMSQSHVSKSLPQVADLRIWREKRSWERVVRHLNANGLSPCVPCELVSWLRRRGLSAWCQECA